VVGCQSTRALELAAVTLEIDSHVGAAIALLGFGLTLLLARIEHGQVAIEFTLPWSALGLGGGTVGAPVASLALRSTAAESLAMKTPINWSGPVSSLLGGAGAATPFVFSGTCLHPSARLGGRRLLPSRSGWRIPKCAPSRVVHLSIFLVLDTHGGRARSIKERADLTGADPGRIARAARRSAGHRHRAHPLTEDNNAIHRQWASAKARA